MKKVIVLLVAIALMLLTASCGQTQNAPSDSEADIRSENLNEKDGEQGEASNDLYEEADFVPGKIPEYYELREVGFGAENYWYDVAVRNEYMNQNILEYVPEDVKDAYLEFCRTHAEGYLEEVEMYGYMAEGLRDRGYIFLVSPSYWMYTDNDYLMEYMCGSSEQVPNVVIVEENYWLYEMNVDEFHNAYLPALREHYLVDESCPIYEDFSETTGVYARVTRGTSATYNYITGERLTVETLFVEGYDYEAEIRSNTKNRLIDFHGYDAEQAERMVQNMRYSVKGDCVEVDVWDGEEMCTEWIPFWEFPKEALTIFE